MLVGFCFVSNWEHFSHIQSALEEENIKELQEPQLALKINIVIFILHRGLPYIDIHLHFELIPDFLYCLNPLCNTMKINLFPECVQFLFESVFFFKGMFPENIEPIKAVLEK